MKASDVMSRDLVTVSPDTTIGAAGALMVEKRISGLPVVDETGALKGVFTESDLLHRVETGTETGRHGWVDFLLGFGAQADRYIRSHSRRVGDLMTSHVHTVEEDAPLAAVVDIMERRRVRRVPVLRGGKLVGLITRNDLIRALVAKAAAAPAPSGDAGERLEAELKQQPWIAAANLGISVHEGKVRLEGVIYDARVHQALLVAARNVSPSGVDDRLYVADPYPGLVGA